MVSAFAVDLNRMAHGRPVVFSNWGLNYMPEADLEEVELEKAIRDYVLCEQDRVIEYRKEAMERQNQSFDDPKGFVEMHIFQIDKLDQEYIVYSQVLEEVYYLENGKITCECGSNIPTVYRLCRNINGQFEVISSKQPEDGERYAESLKEMFPRSVMRKFKSFNNKAKDAEMIFRMKQQVQEYYRGRGSN